MCMYITVQYRTLHKHVQHRYKTFTLYIHTYTIYHYSTTALLLTYSVSFIQDLVAQYALENILKRDYAYHRIPGIQLCTYI